jgi:hypothetical protein
MLKYHHHLCVAGDIHILLKDEGSGVFHQPTLYMSRFIKWFPRIGENVVIILLL